MDPLVVLTAPAVFAAMAACAAMAGGMAPRRWAIVPLFAAVALPWAVPATLVPLRGIAALAALMFVFRGIDLLVEAPPRPVVLRVAHIFSIVDSRRLKFVGPTVRTGLVASGLCCAAAGIAALVGMAGAESTTAAESALATVATAGVGATARAAGPLVRWSLGTVGFYLCFEALDRLIRSVYLLAGLEAEPAQRTPVAARTLAEFWGDRWNSIVHRWLSVHTFRPMVRRGHPQLGLAAAFVVSAAIHAYLVLPALGALAAASMGGFFLIQGALVFAERRLRIARRPRWVAHAWTITAMVATVPLFIEPLLSLAGFAGG